MNKLFLTFFLVIVLSFSAFAQKTITGKVIDATDGSPIPGVSVVIKGTLNGVPTDIDGNYTLTVPNEDAILVFSAIGMANKEVKVGNKNIINVELNTDVAALEEIVVTAFGTGQKKVSMVGSVQSIRPTDLKVPTANLSNSFAGRMSGVIAVQRSGEPGADGSDFWIRGISTLNGVTSPLIIIDGVEVSSADLNALEPEVIDGFSILKDATATALYGSRGANGVMIVTTKSGANLAKPIINFRVETAINEPTSIPKFVDGVNYMKLYNEGVKNLSSNVLPYPQEKIEMTEAGGNQYIFPNVDWYNEIFRKNTFNQRANLNIRGGGKKLDYFMSGSVNHDEGMIKGLSSDYFSFDNNIDVLRYAFQNNINLHLSDYSKISLRLNAQFMDKTSPNQSVKDIYGRIMSINPVDFPIYYEQNELSNHIKWGAYAGSTSSANTNPIANLVSGYSDTFESTVIANLGYEQKLDFWVKGLKFSARTSFKNWSRSVSKRSAPKNVYELVSYNKGDDGNYTYVPGLIGEEQTVVLTTEGWNSGDRRLYFQGMLEYNKSFGVHNFSSMLVYHQDEYSLNNIDDDDAFQRLLNSLPKRRQGLSGRLSYGYDNRYLVEVNAGYNGSENFAEKKRFGFFPSVAIGYNVSEESYFEPLKDIITWFKIRGSWGLVGNDNTGSGRFAYMSDINLYGKGYRTGVNQDYQLNGPTYNRYQNYDLTWEVGEKTNLGIDMQFLGSLNLTVDLFKEIRSDIFQKRTTIPTYLGTADTEVYGNLAKIKNWGFDGTIDYAKQMNKNLLVTFKGTFTFARNKILEYDEAAFQQYPQLSKIGTKVNQYLLYIDEGLFIDEAEIEARPEQLISGNVSPGDIKYKNLPNYKGEYDDVIDGNDRVYMGDPSVPEIVYGLGANIIYKQIDFGLFFQGVGNTSLIMGGIHPFGTQNRRNVLEFVAENHWDPYNQDLNAKYPRLTHDDHKNNTEYSTYWLRDASFLKLKNLEIGYTPARLKNLRVYFSGNNLLTFSKFKHWDPEQGQYGFEYPTQRIYSIGLQMTIN